jgi:hypothetical protein
MFDQLLENFRKASESSMQMQQDVFRQWTQQWLSPPPNASGVSAQWYRTLQKRWHELAIELLSKNRESLDAAWQAGIQVIDQSFRVTEAKSPEDTRRMVEDLWRKLFDTFKAQSETQFREFQQWSERSFEMVQNAQVTGTNGQGHQQA